MTWWRRYGNVPYRNALGRFEFEPHEEPDADVTPTERMRRLSDVGEPYLETVDLKMFSEAAKPLGYCHFTFNETQGSVHGYDRVLLSFGVRVAACQRRIPEDRRKTFRRMTENERKITCIRCRRWLYL